MRELKNSEIEDISGGRAVMIEPTTPFERFAFAVAVRIAALHFGIKLPAPMPQPK